VLQVRGGINVDLHHRRGPSRPSLQPMPRDTLCLRRVRSLDFIFANLISKIKTEQLNQFIKIIRAATNDIICIFKDAYHLF
jgi:hypothetical protein